MEPPKGKIPPSILDQLEQARKDTERLFNQEEEWDQFHGRQVKAVRDFIKREFSLNDMFADQIGVLADRLLNRDFTVEEARIFLKDAITLLWSKGPKEPA